MANQEHVDRLLGQDVTSWNLWREQHVNEQPDLSGVKLSGANLREADLSEAKLDKAKLRGANLERMQGEGATFQGADLRDIPWLFIMELTLQPGIDCTGILWDKPTDA